MLSRTYFLSRGTLESLALGKLNYKIEVHRQPTFRYLSSVIKTLDGQSEENDPQKHHGEPDTNTETKTEPRPDSAGDKYSDSQKDTDSLSDTRSHVLQQILHFPIGQGIDGDVSPLLDTANLPTIELPESVKSVPYVTKILQATMPSEQLHILKQWERKMIMKFGEERFKEYREETFLRGHNLHAALQAFLQGTPEDDVPVVPSIIGYWESVQKVLGDISEIKSVECKTSHPYLQYGGVFDCIAKYRGKLCVIDWKTSEKPKKLITDTYDNPLQIAAYIGAVNFDKMFDVQVECGLLVISYSDGTPGDVHIIEERRCYDFWYLWLRRLRRYWLLQNKKSSETDQ